MLPRNPNPDSLINDFQNSTYQLVALLNQSYRNQEEVQINKFKMAIADLKVTILDSLKGENSSAVDVDKILTFMQKFICMVQILSSPPRANLYLETKQAVEAVFADAKDCTTIWEKLEPIATPAAGILGGGIAAGVGVAVNGSHVPARTLGAIAQNHALRYLPGHAILGAILIEGLAQSFRGGYAWASMGANFAEGVTHRFLKPVKTIPEIIPTVLGFSFFDNLLCKRAVDDATKIPDPLVNIIVAYRK